ncbi:unnamed protein product [Peronospora farinosa]|uniref:RxLR effector protein n=1 Tax=Peronospora farinosa TaxID=134698 RepID=A0AAV0SRN7_9STRA|nr:unnamed protein product [Peronospora farinosa]
MLIITALIVWSAACAASVMPVHAIRSAHKSTTWNVTNTLISGSSVSMDSNYYSSEERGGPPADIVTILKNFHAPTQPSATIETMSEEFARVTQNGENFLRDWKKSVKSQDPKLQKEAVNEVMFKTLAGHFQGDALSCFLVAGTKIDTTRDIALELLDLQVHKWVSDGRNEEEVYKLLELDQPKSNPFESPVFLKWIKFVSEIYTTPKRKTYKVLAKQFKGDELAKVLVEGTKTGFGKSKNRARKLLDLQVDKWKSDKRNEEDVFKLLQLDKTDGKPLKSPIFHKWANFIWQRYPDDEPDKMILDKLSSFYKSKNALVGALEEEDRATLKKAFKVSAIRKILNY